MNESHLAQRVRVHTEDDGARVTLTPLEPHLNYSHADELKTRLCQAIGECWGAGVRTFVLDLSRVDVMDSCGMSVLISVRKQIEGLGGELRVAAPSPMIERLFAITRLGGLFGVCASVEEALAGAAEVDGPASSTNAASTSAASASAASAGGTA